MRPAHVLFPVLVAVLSACNEFPALDDTVDSDARNAPYPELVPIEQLNAQAPDPRIKPETAPQTQARIDRLKSRASRLKGDVVDAETQQRMRDGIE
ncbi:hypothetical protein AAFO92_13765 [Roseovarius sp. CAU 1744]|uniref:hypothetical protein n=1 Tax=Roseovarius sp. CAU 1744 TaxID=3140368 RepID=UPI00325B14AD